MSVRLLRKTLVALLSFSAACSDSTEPEPGPNPTPTLSAVLPASVLVGGDDFTLTLRGERFAEGAIVRWNGQTRPTTRVSGTELRADITAADIAERGRAAVTVVNPAPGGGESSARNVEISDVPVASLTVTPNPATVAAGQTLQLVAKALDANGIELGSRPVTWRSSAEQVARIAADGIVTGMAPGQASIVAAVEGIEVAVPLTVSAPSTVPLVAALVPAIAVAGDPALTLSVRGSGFTDQAVAHWNGQPRATRFVNARELEVQLEVADLASAGTARIDVRAAGVGSNEMAFVVSAGVASVEVLGPADLWSSDVSQYVAVARDAERRELPGRTVQWSSANTNVLMVDTHGLVFAPGSGATTLTARVGTVAGSTRVTVVGRPAHDVIYHSMRSGRPMLIRQPMDADEPAQAVMAEQRYAVQAAVSPDGQKIAFVSLNGTTGDIYVVNRDGTGLRRLTDHAASDEHPAWSPDGARIAFRSERSGAGDIWVMNADGSDQRQVTGLEYQFGDPSSFHPVWSLDGQRILFAQGSSTVSPFRSVIMSIRPDGTDLRAVTNRAGYSDEAPALSPDGRFLAIARRQVGAAERHITLLSPDGTELVLITYPGRGTDPAWSPDGQWLAYTDADGDIALTRPNEEIVRKITARNTGGGESATWIPR